MVIDLSDLSNSYSVLPPGEVSCFHRLILKSGHLQSTHYDDQVNLYLEGKLKKMLWKQEDIQKNAQGTLIISSKE